VLQLMDLTTIAERIDTPFQLVPLTASGGIEAGLVICEGPKRWHRSPEQTELMLVLEGVITVDTAAGNVVVNEGEMARLPASQAQTIISGMRTTVVLFRKKRPSEHANGHHPLPDHSAGGVKRTNFGASVHASTPFEWLRAGSVGGYEAFASRISGSSDPFPVPDGALLLVVFRGVLEYEDADGESGTAIGNQMLIADGEQPITLRSVKGATVVAVARAGAALPQASSGSTGEEGAS